MPYYIFIFSFYPRSTELGSLPVMPLESLSLCCFRSLNKIYLEGKDGRYSCRAGRYRMDKAQNAYLTVPHRERPDLLGDHLPSFRSGWNRRDRKSTRLNSSHVALSRMPSS